MSQTAALHILRCFITGPIGTFLRKSSWKLWFPKPNCLENCPQAVKLFLMMLCFIAQKLLGIAYEWQANVKPKYPKCNFTLYLNSRLYELLGRDRAVITVHQRGYKATYKFCMAKNEDYVHPKQRLFSSLHCPYQRSICRNKSGSQCESILRYLSNSFKHWRLNCEIRISLSVACPVG